MFHPLIACAALAASAVPPAVQAGSRAIADGVATSPVSSAPAAPDPTITPGSLRIDRGEGQVPLWVPAGEELVYDVRIDIGILGSVGVGKVTLSSGVEDYRPGLPMPGAAPASTGKKTAWVRSFADGGHLGYHLQHELLTRILPQAWPRFVHQDTQTGTENRRRELKIGERDGSAVSSYRADGHCGGCERREHFVSSALPWGSPHHCEGCKRAEHRLWHEPTERALPADAIDMLSAVYVARSYMREGWEATSFPVIDKERLWTLLLSHGGAQEIETPAGNFPCTEILLRTQIPPDEKLEEGAKFKGLFGIQGDLHIWMDSTTGVPVLIQGDLPVGGIMELGIDVRLESYRGTPDAFRPMKEKRE